MPVEVCCIVCGENATELYPIGRKKYLGTDIPQIMCNLLRKNSEPTLGNSLICSSCITTLRLMNAKVDCLRREFAPPAGWLGCSTPNETNSAFSKILTKMSVDVCKACGGNATELYPISRKTYFGIDIPLIICNLLPENYEPTFGNSHICSSCITALYLINVKVDYLRRAYARAAIQIHSDIGCSIPNKTKSVNSKPVLEIRKMLRSGNVETLKRTAPSNKNALPKSPSKKTPNVKNSAETVHENVVAKKTPVAKKSTDGKVKLNAIKVKRETKR